MIRWTSRGSWRVVSRTRQHARIIRCLSIVTSGTHGVERVSVGVGSSGSVHIDLHNIAKVSSTDPLMVYLPPYSTASPGRPVQIPACHQRHPTAVINYRWAASSVFHDQAPSPAARCGEDAESHQNWPAPIHDTLKAYSWIIENLSPPNSARRDVYVFGTFLGASLATSLALTETHPHQRMALRGCVAFNGIYNWTMFLPDHPINKVSKTRSTNFLEQILSSSLGDPALQELKDNAEALFGKPDNLFDAFASSCLFFHTPGLYVPRSFDSSALSTPSLGTSSMHSLLDPSADDVTSTTTLKPSRKSALVFPPRKSTLKIPEMLLLHTTPPPLPPSFQRRRQRRKKDSVGNSFKTQAEELGGLMRRSINKLELRERLKWDEDFDDSGDEASRRVQVFDVGLDLKGAELCDKGYEVAATWLEDRL